MDELGLVGVILLVGFCVLYIVGGIVFRKKGKPALWNSLLVGGVVLLLAVIFRGNYLFLRLPSFESKSGIVFMIWVCLLSLTTGYYGKYRKGDAAYQWNVLFVRPTVLEIGFTGLVLPYLHHVSFLQNWIPLIIIPVTLGVVIVAVIQAILNIIDKEYRMNLWIQIIYDIIVTSFNAILVMFTQSVWVILLPRGLYALTGLYRSKKHKKANN